MSFELSYNKFKYSFCIIKIKVVILYHESNNFTSTPSTTPTKWAKRGILVIAILN